MITEKRAINLLKKYSHSKKQFKIVFKHSVMVRDLAIKLSDRITDKRIDKKFVATAALLHDIGRFDCPPKKVLLAGKRSLFHGVVGAAILRKEKLPKHARVAERHVGAGISKAEAKKLGLPEKAYLPKTIEEKIVCYADSFIIDEEIRSLNTVLKRYRKFSSTAAKRIKRLDKELRR
ncbi:MAG: HDIG domain-containing protein [bacterium]|nr:HDIG domain-containing protein [bacterium]